jgi:hypothetical protein
LIDFRNGGSDTGLYALNGALEFYPVASGAGPGFGANGFVQVVLTRDGARNVRGYVNGVERFSFVDSGNDAALDGGNVLRFFRDDGSEASAGVLARLRVFDVALGAAQVAALDRLPGEGPVATVYRVTWPNVAAGDYVLTARATDDRGAIGVSAPVSVRVAVPLPGFGDMFANRGFISGFTNFIVGTNTSFTRETGEPQHDNRGGTRSAWVSWLAPLSGVCMVDTLGSSFDTVIGVYSGATVSSLVWVASNDDASPSLFQSRVIFNAVAGARYEIAVDGYGANAFGTIVFHLSLPLGAPVVLTQPRSVVVNPGGSASFSVVAAGVAPLAYQWLSNGVPLTGATGASLTRSSVRHVDGAVYSVAVGNGLGFTNSLGAELIVRPEIVWAGVTNGQLRLLFNAMPHRTHAVEMSPGFGAEGVLNWSPLNTNLNNNVLGEFLEPISEGETSRIYRVRLVQ